MHLFGEESEEIGGRVIPNDSEDVSRPPSWQATLHVLTTCWSRYVTPTNGIPTRPTVHTYFSTDSIIFSISMLIFGSSGSGQCSAKILRALAVAQSRASSFLVSHSLYGRLSINLGMNSSRMCLRVCL